MTSRDHDRPVTRSFEHRGVTFTIGPKDIHAVGIILHLGTGPETVTTDPRFLAARAAGEIEHRGGCNWFFARALVLREHGAAFVGNDAFMRRHGVRDDLVKQPADLSPEARALKLAHPELEVGSYREHAAKNMRKLLRAAFPGVKISVTQPRGSMVYSIDVTWTGGPERDEVAAICGRFVSSQFDGMTDGYNSCRTAWTDTFGGCNGVFYRREG